MKKVWKYFAAGCAVAIAGLFFSVNCGDFLNGMDHGSACALGMGMYLCVVVVTCTGILVSKVSSKPKEDVSEGKE